MHANLTMDERIKDLRVNRHMTLEELAEATGMSSSALGSYENEQKNDIGHTAIMKLAKFYGVTSDYLLGLSENKQPENADVDALHLSDQMITFLQEGQLNRRLLEELVLHPDFPKLLADIEIYVDRIAAMQIDTLNATVDGVRREIINKYNPDESDIHMKTLESAHINETEYFYHRISDDLQAIIADIRNNHKKDSDTAPKESVTEKLQKDLAEAAAIPCSDQERQARYFLMQLGINYDSLHHDEFVTLINILKKSKMLKSPISKRGRSCTKKRKR